MVVSQRLLPKQNSVERIPGVEILINNSAVSTSIREGKTFLIANILETTEGEGSILFEKNLLSLYRAGMISKETAYSYAIRPKEIARLIK